LVRIFVFITLFALLTVNKAVATTFECSLEFQNDTNYPVVIMYQSYYPELETELGKLKKLTIPEFQSRIVSYANIPYIKWDVISPKRKVNIIQSKTATSCNNGGKVKIELRT